MQDYVIQTDSEDLLGAFYIQHGEIYYTHQKDPSNKENWSKNAKLPVGQGSLPSRAELIRIEVCKDNKQQIQIVVVDTSYNYYITYQETSHRWSTVSKTWAPWAEITQS